jgi:hypothetical protein
MISCYLCGVGILLPYLVVHLSTFVDLLVIFLDGLIKVNFSNLQNIDESSL